MSEITLGLPRVRRRPSARARALAPAPGSDQAGHTRGRSRLSAGVAARVRDLTPPAVGCTAHRHLSEHNEHS